MALGAHRYCDVFTWSHALTEHSVAHTDGAVSVAILWAGLDCEFEDASGRARSWEVVGRALAALPDAHWMEFHLWRERSAKPAQDYFDYYARAVRKSPLAAAVRSTIAEHLGPQMFVNTAAVVLGRLPGPHGLGVRRSLRDQARSVDALENVATRLAEILPGARLGTTLEYAGLIQKSYDKGPPLTSFDPWLSLAEQVIAVPPVSQKRSLEVNGRPLKMLYLHLYPHAEPGWILPLFSRPICLHASQVIVAADTEYALRASERADRLASGALAHKGRERQLAILRDMQAFRKTVADHDLRVHRNAFVVSVETQDLSHRDLALIVDSLQGRGGRVRDDDFIQLPFLRVSQPGQGYRAPVWRPDHAVQIAAMAPVQVFRSGSSSPESLRLGLAGQAVNFDYTHQVVAHGFTVAMTGAGKGVDKVATIAETYPFGIDWYVLEIGSTYRWVVEGLGGTYTRLDPSYAAVNPLPSRSGIPGELDPLLASGTLNILAFILTDGRTVLDFHESAAGAAALARLYGPSSEKDPGLVDFLQSLESLVDVSPEQRTAAQRMSANLHSFLNTPEGRIFAGPDNVQISPGISGIDLRDVDRASPKLLTFYLVFLCLRFLNLAFSQGVQARVLLDEIHRFVANAPDVLRRLVSEIARMGRKEGAAIDIVTQGISEIDVMEKEILNSMPLRSLLYRSDGWDDIAARIAMPAQALDIWRRLPYPLNLAWRPAIRSVGADYYSMRLTFPRLLLALADTTPQGLIRKDAIGRRVADPLQRLAQFLESKS